MVGEASSHLITITMFYGDSRDSLHTQSSPYHPLKLTLELSEQSTAKLNFNQLGFGSDKVVFWALLSNMFKSNHKENKSTVQCTVHLYSLLIDYLMADFKHSQIRQLGAEIESISLLCLNAHCRVKFLCADLRFGLLRLSTMKKCPHMLRSDHRELRNS